MNRRNACLLLFLSIAVTAPVLAALEFEWYYAGGPGSFVGNLTSGMDSYDDEIWVAMYSPAGSRGIHVFDVNDDQWGKTYPGSDKIPELGQIAYLTVDESQVWLCGRQGVGMLDRATGDWTILNEQDGLPTADVRCVDFKGEEIWFATAQGIAKTDGSGNWEYFDTTDGLCWNITSFLVFDGPTLWIATEDGVSQFETESGEWSTYTEADGLTGKLVRKILVDGDFVWFAGKGGVSRLNAENGEIASYTPSDGLLSEEFNDIETMGDNIYFASGSGINYRDRTKDGKWKAITTKQGLPPRSDVTHLVALNDELWIALWYEGIVRMSVPSALEAIPIWIWIMVLAVIGGAMLFILKPGARKKEGEERAKRRVEGPRESKARRPYDICQGTPKSELCSRCKYNTLKSGNLYCTKYQIQIKYK